MKRICVTDAIKLLEPIEHDEVALAMFEQSYSVVTSSAICELKHCSARRAETLEAFLAIIVELR